MIADRYSLEDQIGVGGMAVVWRATDTLLGRQVAIKRLSPHLKANREASERFRREGQAAARLNHPGILTVFDAGEDDEGPWIAMELIEGETLAQRLARDGPMDLTAVASFMDQAAAAVDYAHENGIVHRDIKPANLMIEPGGRVRLADFGIAKPLDDSATITSPGEVVGTISYVAPEIIGGQQASPASDIYSLAAVAYEMLAGEKPYRAETTAGLLDAIRRAEGPVLAGKVPPGAAPALARALSGEPGGRQGSAQAFATELTQPGTLVLPTPVTPGEAASVTHDKALSSNEPTILVSPAVPQVSQSGAPGAHRSEEPAPHRPDPRRGAPRRLIATIGLVIIVAVVVALAMASGRPDANAAVTATTTPITATTASTTTASTTTASIPAQSTPVLLAGQISELLERLGPPDYKPKDVKEVEDGVYKAIDQWEKEDPEAAARTLDQVSASLGEFPESEDRDALLALLARLAEAMDLD